MSHALKKTTALFASVLFLIFSGVSSAQAAPGDSITLYLSAPLVQGSSVSGVGSATDDFNSYSTGNCPTSTGVGTLVAAPTGACLLSNVQTYGGASSTTSTPSFGGLGSKFPATPFPSPGTITFNFTAPVKYVGFWWSAGNTGNTVEFLNGGNVIATYTTSSLMTLLGGTVPSPYPSGNGSVTSIGGDQYPKGRYFGNPRGFSSTTPNTLSTVEPNFPFVYMNLYLNGGLAADSVRFSGDGFEFDNITTSTLAQTPESSMVLVGGVLGKSVQFMPNASGTTGSMNVQTDTTTANLTANSFDRPGYSFTGWNTQANNGGTPYTNEQSYNFAADLTLHAQWAPLSYQVTYDSQGGSAATGSTYLTGGSVTLASAPTRAGYTFDGWFVASNGGSALGSSYSPPGYGDITLYAHWTALPAQTMTWSPTNTTTSTSPLTPDALASTSGDGAITYSVVSTGSSNCTVNPTTGVITFTVAGLCTVRATAAATANFSSAYIDRVFTLNVPTVTPASLPNTGVKTLWTLAAGLSAFSAGLFAMAFALFLRRRKS